MSTKKSISILLLSLGLILSPPLFASSFWSPMTDTVNSGIINSKILGNSAFSNVDVTVDNAIVIFSGEVYSRAQVNQLIRMARSISGIKGVDVSRLRVQK